MYSHTHTHTHTSPPLQVLRLRANLFFGNVSAFRDEFYASLLESQGGALKYVCVYAYMHVCLLVSSFDTPVHMPCACQSVHLQLYTYIPPIGP